MLGEIEKAEVAAAFGVSEAQVERDHLISHVLLAISALDLPLTFFGGTALSRTHFSDPVAGARLSEDIDLYASSRRKAAATLDHELPTLIRREFPGAVWDPPLGAVRGVDPGQLVTREGVRVRVQLLDLSGDHHHLAAFPTEVSEILLRYADTPGYARLRVPTVHAFAAMKTMAWFDRRTARDLYDLVCLARLNVLDDVTAAMVRKISGVTVKPYFFDRVPADWETQLAHQTGRLMTARDCLAAVRAAFASGLGWEKDEDRN